MHFFEKIFYPPSFLQLSPAGVEISNHAIKYVEFENISGTLRIRSAGAIPLTAGVVQDGAILRRDAFMKALVELRRRLSTPFIKVSVPEEECYIFSTRVPYEAREHLDEQVLFKLEENVPLKVSEVNISYDVIKSSRARVGDDILLAVSVVPKKLTDELANAFSGAGLSIISFGIEPRMLTKSVIIKRDHRAFMIVHLKESSTSMTYAVNGVVRFASTVKVGGAAIREGLTKINPKLYDEQGRFVGTPTTFDAESFYSLLNVFSVIKDEVKRFSAYISSKADKHDDSIPEGIDEIILVGQSAAIPGLPAYIGQGMKTGVVLGNVWTNAFDVNTYVPDVPFTESLEYGVAVGCALPSFKK